MNRPIREGFVAEEPAHTPPDVIDAQPEAAAPEPEPFREEWPIKVKLLHKTIRDNKGNELRELTFRQPTGGDINRNGIPVRVDGTGEVVIDERKMTLMMTALTGIMTPMLEAMDPRDWASCAYRLRGFFLPDPAAW
jgi:hypothetical protein